VLPVPFISGATIFRNPQVQSSQSKKEKGILELKSQTRPYFLQPQRRDAGHLDPRKADQDIPRNEKKIQNEKRNNIS
jgi:hypothetical protein